MVSIGNDWDGLLAGEFEKPYYLALRAFLKDEYRKHTVYPNMYDIFNALKLTPYGEVKAVILGQDPYHGPNQAHGLAFSVREGIQPPPSLVNMFKEIEDDVGEKPLGSGCLDVWARQGVLLLNTALTVREFSANSHSGKGWEIFTDRVISLLNEREKPVVFLLWGRNAKNKQALITNRTHFALTAAHPSPLSAHSGFFGCGHFSKTNEILKSLGENPIAWGRRDV
jgi:uracil-DNA glycosylase